MACEICSGRAYLRIPALREPHGYLFPDPKGALMVIGESPTPAEASTGKVMTGAGAKVLRDTMQAVGLPFEDDEVYYTTAIKCALPKKKGYKPPKDCSMNCRSYLLSEIDIVKPKLILVCGALAYQTLTGRNDVKITQEYGNLQWLDYETWSITDPPALRKEFAELRRPGEPILDHTAPHGTQVIPIMNPGVLMHDPKGYKPFLMMLQLAAKTYQGEERFDAGSTRWTVLRTAHDAKELWEKMKFLSETGNQLDVVTFDTETTGLDYRTAEFLVMGICFEKNHVYIIPRELRHFVHNFTDGVPWKCYWQNGMYDKKVLWRRNIANPQIDGDSMYMHYALDETSQHDLEYLAKTYLNAEPYKYKMNQNWKAVTLESYPEFFEALCERVAVDCDYTRQVVFRLWELLNQEENSAIRKMYETMLIPTANFLARVEQNGILIDDRPLRTMDVKYTELLEEIRERISELAAPFWDPDLYMHETDTKSFPGDFNPGSPKQMAWMVFDRLKLKPRIKKGRSTDKDILKSIENPPELVRKVLEFRKVQKEHSTYVLGLLNARDVDNRVRTSYTVHVTATGRLSSKEPNVQNQPSANGVGNIRSAFIAPPERLLAEIDYQGAELRWMAFLSNCPVLGEVFREGRNLHNETATGLFGVGYTKAQKLRAKAINFGIPYGREPKSLAEEFNISLEEAQEMHRGWLDLYHGARDYLQWCADQVLAGNYLETPYGRRRRFGLVTKQTLHALQNEAKNFIIQSASSDTTSTAAMMMEKTLREKYDTKIINLVHDSILMELPADPYILAEVNVYANGIMSSIPKDKFGCTIPFNTDFEIGKNWGELVGFEHKDRHAFWENKDGSWTRQPFYEWYEKVMEAYR